MRVQRESVVEKLFDGGMTKTSDERGLDDRIISPGVKRPRVTQSSTSRQCCLSSPINGRKSNMSQNLSPQSPVNDEGSTSPGAVSVPLKATPGFRCLRLQVALPDLFRQRSTCDKKVVNAGDMNRQLDNKRESHGAVTKAQLNTSGEKSLVSRSKTNLEPKTPRKRRLKARHVNKYNNWTNRESSHDDSSKTKSGKLNSTL